MKKSARLLAQEIGLKVQEMYIILQEEGFLERGPGGWIPTEKGKPRSNVQHIHHGTGGYAYYNASWTSISWDEEIVDEFNITEERIAELRQALKTAKQKIEEAGDKEIVFECDSNNDETSEIANANNEVLTAAIIVLLIAVTSYGMYKAYPYIKRWWNDKAVPGIKRNRKKITIGVLFLGLLAFIFPFAFRKE